jgi:hypothetical protein
MSDTPETDACKSATKGESIFDLCERLERERDEARDAIVGWEKKWNMAVEMTAIAENERDLLKEDLINLEDQRDLAMKVLKRLEAQLAQKEQ